MKELEYPFDSKLILSKKLRLRKQLKSDGRTRIQKKIAILGGSTTNDIRLCLELFLLDAGIEPQFYESEYNQYYQDAMFPSQEFLAFHPDFIYLHTTSRNITKYPAVTDSAEAVEMLLRQEEEKFTSVWEHLHDTFHCPIIQNNFEMPMFRLLGNMDCSDLHGARNFISRLNQYWASYAQTHENFWICDLEYAAADYGLKEWSDPQYWYLYKYALNLNAIPSLSFQISNIIKSILGKNKKGFVLDLDNTLWGGVIGDDGVDGIEIGPEEAVGQAYLEFQNYLKLHKQLGILLNVDSKNDYENAIGGLNHPDGVLRPDDMIVIKANWEPKDRNFSSIASELNLLPESLVFVDDNPAERHIVSEQLPGVAAPEIGNVEQYILTLDRSGYFEITSLSADDFKRNQMYKENVERAQLEAKFENYKDYLLSLQMTATIRPFEPIFMSRIAQLTNKSNQFNLTTKRYTLADIEQVAENPEYLTLYGKLEDRFGDNGVVSLLIGHEIDHICHLDLWLMSCRVLKRDMEFAMMDALAEQCQVRDIHKIAGYYYPTAKNGMVRNFYADMGFQKCSEDSEGNTVWELELDNYQNQNHVIQISKENSP